MKLPFVAVACALVFLAAFPATAQQASSMPLAGMPGQKGGTDDTGPYTVVANWYKPLQEGFLDRGSAVFAESPNRIYFTTDRRFSLERGAVKTQEPHHTIQVIDGDGKLIEEWTQWESMLDMPHFITESPYDREKAVWVISREGQQIFKFSNDGKKLLMTLGEKGVTASDKTHFGRPSSMAFLPDGSFYVADGYANRRIVKFDKDGKYLFEFGGVGSGPGQFAAQGEVHAIAIDAQRRIYVGDRGNRRVQIFDENGKFLDEWDGIQGPSDIKITADGSAWVTSGVGNRLAKYDTKTGRLITYWGMFGTAPGMIDRPHFISVDSQGNLYVAQWNLTKSGIDKYVPRLDADPSRLVGQPLVLK